MAESNTKQYFPEKGKYHYGTGRRKSAVAKVRLYTGTGKLTVNGLKAEDYFGDNAYTSRVEDPLKLLDLLKKHDVHAEVIGGGKSAQAVAVRHGLARALVIKDLKNRDELKKAGFLMRDPREKERKKPGLKRARKKPQFSKR
ncbi:30S ribosomal protein S9 [Patescibacteria group bacterium]